MTNEPIMICLFPPTCSWLVRCSIVIIYLKKYQNHSCLVLSHLSFIFNVTFVQVDTDRFTMLFLNLVFYGFLRLFMLANLAWIICLCNEIGKAIYTFYKSRLVLSKRLRIFHMLLICMFLNWIKFLSLTMWCWNMDVHYPSQ